MIRTLRVFLCLAALSVALPWEHLQAEDSKPMPRRRMKTIRALPPTEEPAPSPAVPTTSPFSFLSSSSVDERLNDLIRVTPNADMHWEETQALVELSQCAAALRGHQSYQQSLRNRIQAVQRQLQRDPQNREAKERLANLEENLQRSQDEENLAALRLQSCSERLSQLASTLSSVSKSHHETAKAIIRNLK